MGKDGLTTGEFARKKANILPEIADEKRKAVAQMATGKEKSVSYRINCMSIEEDGKKGSPIYLRFADFLETRKDQKNIPWKDVMDAIPNCTESAVMNELQRRFGGL